MSAPKERKPLARKAPSVPSGDLEVRVAELEQRVAAMSTEVRTRRIVVVDEHDDERIVGEVADEWAMFSVATGDQRASLACHPVRVDLILTSRRVSDRDDLGWARARMTTGLFGGSYGPIVELANLEQYVQVTERGQHSV